MTLIQKHLGDQSDLVGMSELKAMQHVGNEFMTSDDGANRVQKSGEFVEITHRGGSWLRLLSVCEPANNRTTGGVLLDGELGPEPGEPGFVPRTFVVKAATGPDGDEDLLDRRAAPAWRSRLPRFTLIEGRDSDVDTVTKLGRPRIWSLGGGKVLRVRETGGLDDRFFLGSRGPGIPVRRDRVTKVELVVSDPDTQSGTALMMEFFPISGLGFDPGGRQLRDDWEERGATTDFDADYVYRDRVGQHFGRLSTGVSGDPSGTYCIAPPAWVIDEPGAPARLHIAAVYARPGDLASAQVSSPRSLTCTYLDSAGESQHSTIEFAPYSVPAGRYPGVSQYRLYRLAPQCLLLVSSTRPLIEPGGPFLQGTDWSGPPARMHWSIDGGQSWEETPAAAWASTPAGIRNGSVPLGAVVPQGEGRALVFSGYVLGDDIPAPDAEGVYVLQLTPQVVTATSIIPGREFSQGLLRPLPLDDKDFYARYVHSAETGGACGKLAWAQFDPAWMQRADYAWGLPAGDGGLGFPFERPMIMVTEDDGVTFARRLLPDPIASRTGFVVALDERTMAVPVFFPRPRLPNDDMPVLRGRVYTSMNGGRSWRTGARFSLPYYCRADGQLFPDEYVAEYSPDRFNRGELFPLVPLTDELERSAAISPGRPWLTDSRIKEPTL